MVRANNNALISGHSGGLTPGIYMYGRIARDLLTFVPYVWTTFALPR